MPGRVLLKVLLGAVVGVGVVLLAGVGRAPAGPPELTVAVASSLRNTMPEVAQGFRHAGGSPLRLTYGASGDLRKQVEAGAPIDAVVFASAKPVDALIKQGQLAAGSRAVVATNRLVLIGPKGSKPLTFAALGSLPEGERVAIGEPGAVPAGQYAVEALKALGNYEALESRFVFGGDVAGVLAYARRGEVAAAIVYGTEAQGIPDIEVLDEAQGEWAPRPEVVAAATTQAGDKGARVVEFLKSAEGQRILKAHGFGAP